MILYCAERFAPPCAGRLRLAPRPAGFTLVELVIVVMILGLLAGVAAPRYGVAIAKTHLEAAARELAANLRRAQAVAHTTAQAVTVVINPATETYTSSGMRGFNRGAATLAVNVADHGYGVAIGSSTFGAGANVTFNHRGEPSAAGSVTITSNVGSAVVSVNALGLIEVTL